MYRLCLMPVALCLMLPNPLPSLDAQAKSSLSSSQDSVDNKKLPEGDQGIASEYPNDEGIGKHDEVVFVEDFEDGMESLKKRWESISSPGSLKLDSSPAVKNSGTKSLLVKHVGGQGTGAHLYRSLKKGYDKLHYRFYVKFDKECAPIHHFFHVGGYNPPTAWPQGGAGIRPQGHERFTTGVEPFGKMWRWDFYSYWMKMRGSPPRGQCWGNSFIRDPKIKVTKGRWQCVELMLKVNDVGKSNGELALWIDGKLVAHLGKGFPQGKWVFDKFIKGEGGDGVYWDDDKQKRLPLKFAKGGEPFEGFQWRSDEKLKLNFVWVLCYITKSPKGKVSRIWFDNIVVAKNYIGPIKSKR